MSARRIGSWSLGLGLATLLLVTCPAQAIETCHGTYTASPSAPLRSPLVLQFNAGTDDQNQVAIAQRFQSGMRAAGVTFDPAATVQMNVAASVSPPGAGAGTPAQPGSYHGFGWAADMSPGAAPIQSGTLTLSVSVTDLQSATIDWTGAITCTIETNDKAALARDIGELIGRTLGSSFTDRRI